MGVTTSPYQSSTAWDRSSPFASPTSQPLQLPPRGSRPGITRTSSSGPSTPADSPGQSYPTTSSSFATPVSCPFEIPSRSSYDRQRGGTAASLRTISIASDERPRSSVYPSHSFYSRQSRDPVATGTSSDYGRPVLPPSRTIATHDRSPRPPEGRGQPSLRLRESESGLCRFLLKHHSILLSVKQCTKDPPCVATQAKAPLLREHRLPIMVVRVMAISGPHPTCIRILTRAGARRRIFATGKFPTLWEHRSLCTHRRIVTAKGPMLSSLRLQGPLTLRTLPKDCPPLSAPESLL
jgi:hypothetical protein